MFTLLLSASLLAPAADPPRYKPNLLVDGLDARTLGYTILDVRAKDAYAAGHIPGAVNVPVGPWAKAVNDGKADAAFWKKELAAVGVGPKKATLVYADDLREAARAWWLLKLAGVPDVRLLNGGWHAYNLAKLPVSKDPVTPTPADPHDWTPEARLAVMADVVKLADGKGAVNVVDARGKQEVEAGKVPGAKVLEWTELLDERTKRFKPPADLIKLFDTQKIDLGKPCVTYCQGGGRAAVMAFGLELMGAKDVRNYHKSWGEYGSEKTTPKEK
jgi:thiosulfate/3-mercaptopyruvate sulfurtransferase